MNEARRWLKKEHKRCKIQNSFEKFFYTFLFFMFFAAVLAFIFYAFSTHNVPADIKLP